MMKIAVFDLDGVLIDCSERLQKCLQESNNKRNKLFWDCFLSDKYMYLDKPITEMIELAKYLDDRGIKIAIVSGRRKDTQYEATLKQLTEFEIPTHFLYLRNPGDLRKDWQYKKDVILELMRIGEVILVVDDSIDVVKVVNELGVDVVYVPTRWRNID